MLLSWGVFLEKIKLVIQSGTNVWATWILEVCPVLIIIDMPAEAIPIVGYNSNEAGDKWYYTHTSLAPSWLNYLL